jgi:hypothetical protein
MTALPPADDAFTVTEAEVRAGRTLPDVDEQSRAARDRELTLLLGLLGLGVGFGIAWLPLGLIVPSLIVTVIAIWSRGGAR